MLLYFNTALPSGGYFSSLFLFFGCFGVVSGLIGKVCNLGGKGSLFSSSSKNILLSKSDTRTPSLSSCRRAGEDGVTDSK